MGAADVTERPQMPPLPPGYRWGSGWEEMLVDRGRELICAGPVDYISDGLRALHWEHFVTAVRERLIDANRSSCRRWWNR